MEDLAIINLYWARDQRAITESERAYGSYCRKIAENILVQREDAEECVNDTWMRSWNAMPPQRPNRLAAFFGKITRNLALDRWRKAQAARRNNGQMDLALDELGDCVGKHDPGLERLELEETSAVITKFLYSCEKLNRQLFVRRYWYLDSLEELSARSGLSPEQIKARLYRMRKQLREALEKEGIHL